MEPRALGPANTTPFKEQKDQDLSELEKTQRALSELSLNKGSISANCLTKDLDAMTPLQSVSLQFARRKSLQHAPSVSSPLARKSWTFCDETQFYE